MKEERVFKGTKIKDKFDGKEYVIKDVRETDNQFGYGVYLYTVEESNIALYRKEFDVLKYPHVENTAVISAFPACGKSYAYKHYQDKYSILDSDSSEFSWIKDEFGNNTKERNPDFPNNYIQHIKENIGKVDVIFVSSHLAVREAMDKEGIRFITVYPKKDMLNEWVGRFYRRGNTAEFIDFQIKNWDNFVASIELEPFGVGVWHLGNNEYIDLSVLRYW